MKLHVLQVTFTGNDEPDETRDSADVVSCGTSIEARLFGINEQPTD